MLKSQRSNLATLTGERRKAPEPAPAAAPQPAAPAVDHAALAEMQRAIGAMAGSVTELVQAVAATRVAPPTGMRAVVIRDKNQRIERLDVEIIR